MLYSFHLAELPPRAGVVPGMKHAETLAMMRLGSPTISLERMQLRRPR